MHLAITSEMETLGYTKRAFDLVRLVLEDRLKVRGNARFEGRLKAPVSIYIKTFNATAEDMAKKDGAYSSKVGGKEKWLFIDPYLNQLLNKTMGEKIELVTKYISEKAHDIFAFRVVLLGKGRNPNDCITVAGEMLKPPYFLHSGDDRDYINTPKGNGYRAFHKIMGGFEKSRMGSLLKIASQSMPGSGKRLLDGFRAASGLKYEVQFMTEDDYNAAHSGQTAASVGANEQDVAQSHVHQKIKYPHDYELIDGCLRETNVFAPR